MKKTEDGYYQLSVGGLDIENDNGRIYLSPGDFDDDTYPVDHKELAMAQQVSNLTAENYQKLRDATTYEERLVIIEDVATYNRSKFKSLSKRRKKIFIKGFTHYDIRTGDLIHYNNRGSIWVFPAPITHTFVEKTGIPFENMMGAWVSELMHP
ncbi:hypothetical protein OBP_181 [Pseudomonas phage OBP]|uniref:hypothetical protein n=1 Tax=Pseudomonas phage OBP TaxID=1124849 RepID=UPI000240D595|nr:hypothetical protein OBP_181 [Pseudomonas phage OBP]AEV89618.1 hypothetical protein OBP_181 [Pseudomonas phage OBP]